MDLDDDDDADAAAGAAVAPTVTLRKQFSVKVPRPMESIVEEPTGMDIDDDGSQVIIIQAIIVQ